MSKMEPIKTLLASVLVLLVLLAASANAIPKIRSPARDSTGDTNAVDEPPVRQFQSCYESIPCGYALYTTERRQPFRRISTYTRNRLCTCDPGRRCVLTDNWQDRRAYVFHCRDSDSSSHMFPFPDRK